MHFHCCVVFLFTNTAVYLEEKETPGKKIDSFHRRMFDDRHLDYFQFFTLQTLSLNILLLLSAALFAKGSLGQSFKCFDSTHSKNSFYNVTKKKKKAFRTQL